MSQQFFDAAQAQLTAPDTILHTYRGLYHASEGVLILTKHRLLFLQEHGWINKHYNTLLNVPYTELSNLTVDASHKLLFTTQNATHPLVTLDTEAKYIEDVINHCIETLQLKEQIKTVTVPRKKRRSRSTKKK